MKLSLGQRYASSIVAMTQQPPDLKWTYWFLEVIVLTMELRLVITPEILKLIPPIPRNAVSQSFVFSLVEAVDIQRMVSAINNPTVIWTILIALLAALSLISLRLFTSKKAIRSYAELAENRKILRSSASTTSEASEVHSGVTWQVTKLFVSSYGYVFYIVGYFTTSIFMCKSVPETLLVSDVNNNLAVVSSSVQIYDTNRETTYVTKWSINMEKQCLAGDYYIMGTFGLAVVFLSIFLKITKSIIAGMYPNPQIYDCRSNNLGLVSVVLFWLTLAARTFIEISRNKEVISVYHGFLLAIQAITLIILLLGRPFHNKTLVKLKVFKSLCVIEYTLYVMLAQSNVQTAQALSESWLTNSKVLWVANLIGAVVTIKVLNTQVDSIYSTATLTDSFQLVYFFECLRPKMGKSHSRHILSASGREFKDILVLANWLKKHRETCNLTYCDCKRPHRWTGLLGIKHMTSETHLDLKEHQTQLLFMVARQLHEQVTKQRGSDQDATASGRMLSLWANFCQRNLAMDATSLFMLTSTIQSWGATKANERGLNLAKNYLEPGKSAKIEYQDKSANKMDINEEILPFDLKILVESFRLKILQKDGEQRRLGVLDDWALAQVEGGTGPQQFIEVNQIMGFFDDTETCEQIMLALFSNRSDILRLFEIQGDTYKLADLSIRQNGLQHQAEGLFTKLEISGTCNYYRTALMRVYYLIHLKEDLTEGRKFLALMRKFRLSSNLTSLIDTGISQKVKTNGMVISVSGEQEQLHRVMACTMNVSDLGFNSTTLIGEDLKSILPTAISNIHKSLFSSHVTGIRPIMLRPKLELFALDAAGELNPATVVYRLNPALVHGLQFTGLIVCEDRDNSDQIGQMILNQEKYLKMYMLTKTDGEILDICQLSKGLFQRGIKLTDHSESVANFYQDFNSCTKINNFTKIWEGKSNAATGFKQFKRIQYVKKSSHIPSSHQDEYQTAALSASTQHLKRVKTHHSRSDHYVEELQPNHLLTVKSPDIGILRGATVYSPRNHEQTTVVDDQIQHSSSIQTGSVGGYDFIEWTRATLCAGPDKSIEIGVQIKVTPLLCYGADLAMLQVFMQLEDINGVPVNPENLNLIKGLNSKQTGLTKGDDFTDTKYMTSQVDRRDTIAPNFKNAKLMPLESNTPVVASPVSSSPNFSKSGMRLQRNMIKPKEETVYFQPIEATELNASGNLQYAKLEAFQAQASNKVKPVAAKNILQTAAPTTSPIAKSLSSSIPEEDNQATPAGEQETPIQESEDQVEVAKSKRRIMTQIGNLVDQASTAHITTTDAFSVTRYTQLLQRSFSIDYSTTAGWAVTFPLILLILYLFASYCYETWAYDRFTGLPLEMNTHDAESYHFWNMFLFITYVNIKRIAIEGLFDETVMEKYGFYPSLERIVNVTWNPGFQNQLWVGADCRYAMNTFKSNYSDFFDQEFLSSDFREYKFYNETSGEFEMRLVNSRDSARYNQLWLNRLLQTDLMLNYSIGPSRNKSLSPYEHVVRWNLHNPHLTRGLECRL